jgi:hypothetical protein
MTDPINKSVKACPHCGIADDILMRLTELYAENIELKRNLEWEYLTPGMKLAVWAERFWNKLRRALLG